MKVSKPKVDLKAQVEKVLRNNPNTRDNDFYLAYYVTLAMGTDPKLITYTEALRRMGLSHVPRYDSIVPRYDSITRLRRVVQNEHPELRGVLAATRKMRASAKKAEARAHQLQLD